ncbi:hypothetical protein [Roseovarius sp. SYSU LYC5161]|jgi:hypothetical protein|uniref:hypothetical protein n=1 Tax=Roseovarius halophilus (ex Wu et al. 2025) TaxID=3376060 RepID=UPI00399ABEE9
MKIAGVMTAAVALAAPGLAQGQTFDLPPGCEAFVTVQGKDCTVSHMFTCEDDPEGHTRRAELDEEMITYIGRVDSEAQWIESFHLTTRHTERLESSPADRASLTELLATDRDTWDFVTQSAEIGPTRYTGEDRLTGESMVIDGVTLLRTEYEITARGADGEELWRGQGREFVHPDWRVFLSGKSAYTTPDDSYEIDGTPVEFIFPGEPGFLSVNPKYGCGVVMSSLAAD